MNAASTSAPAGTEVSVEILHVAGCPNLDRLRSLVEGGLARLGISATIEEIEGSYPSPTLVINGVDVTGPIGTTAASPPASEQARQRLAVRTRHGASALLPQAVSG